jgi:hypothetical protein
VARERLEAIAAVLGESPWGPGLVRLPAFPFKSVREDPLITEAQTAIIGRGHASLHSHKAETPNWAGLPLLGSVLVGVDSIAPVIGHPSPFAEFGSRTDL